jgi:WD40 repeat protein
VEAIASSVDTQKIAIASMGGTVTIWNAVDLKMRHALRHPEGITVLKWHPVRPFVVSACIDGAVRVWDMRNGEMLREMPGHEDVITAMDVRLVGGSDEELLIVTGSDDRTVKIWEFGEKAAVKP